MKNINNFAMNMKGIKLRGNHNLQRYWILVWKITRLKVKRFLGLCNIYLLNSNF